MKKSILKRYGRYSRGKDIFRGQNLFALRVKGDSMRNVGMLPGDIWGRDGYLKLIANR